MNLELTADQQALRDLVRGYLAGRTPSTWAGLAGLGVVGVLTPEEHGGLGLTMVEAGIVAEELGRALYPGPWLSSAVAATRLLTRVGGSEAEALLSAISDGSTIATVALDSAQRPASVALRSGGPTATAVFTEVPDAGAADVLLLTAARDTETILYAVEPAGRGVTVAARPHIDPTRSLSRVTLVETPVRELGPVPHRAMAALVDDVLAVAAADAVGAAQALLDSVVEYAKTRTQFGKPIGAFQAVQHLCVDMFETVELARGGVLYAVWAADAATAAEAHTAALRVKAFAGRLAALGDTAIQVFGGIGFTWEHDAHRYLERLLGYSAFLGAPDTYLRRLGETSVGSAAR